MRRAVTDLAFRFFEVGIKLAFVASVFGLIGLDRVRRRRQSRGSAGRP